MKDCNFFIKKLADDVIIPTRGSADAAGLDLYAYSYENHEPGDKEWGVYIQPGGTLKIRTGISISLPSTCFAGIYPRSGLATKQGLAPANKVGVIDADYRGEIIVALYNHSDVPQIVHRGDRVAQMIVQTYIIPEFDIVDELDETDRGDGGFGSTGTN